MPDNPDHTLSDDAPSGDTPSSRREPPDGRLFGRRQAKALKPRQAKLMDELLPKIAFGPGDLPGLLAAHQGPVFFEIGFGGGEHLCWQAEQHPDALCLGAEPFVNGVAKLLMQMKKQGSTNLRVLHGDARPALAGLPTGSLDRLFLLQPDPWPKKRHHKRRLVSQRFLTEAARVLKLGGELRISSDIADYIRWTLMHWRMAGGERSGLHWTAKRAEDWTAPGEDWPKTRYMEKGEAAGRPVTYLTFRRS